MRNLENDFLLLLVSDFCTYLLFGRDTNSHVYEWEIGLIFKTNLGTLDTQTLI
jgi:hypothetical protein